ncbi:MAG: hypothetical protein NZ839_02900, partial [Endomicrobia bacterium]|nr:hypothetical protein [Endomicrobiia bacterium]
EDIRKFISRYERGKELISTVDKMVATYGEAKKTVEGIVEQYEKTKKLFSGKIESVKENIEQNINYLSKNWNFIEGIVEDLKTQTSDTISKLEKMKEIKNISNNEEKKLEVERIKTSLDLLQLQAQQQTNLLLVKLLEFQISQKEKQVFQNKQIIDRQYQFYTTIKNRLSNNINSKK